MSETRAKLGRRALVVDDELNDQSAAGYAARRVVVALKSGQVDVITATLADDARAIFASDAAIQCVVLDWDLKAGADHASAAALLTDIRARNGSSAEVLLEKLGRLCDYIMFDEAWAGFMKVPPPLQGPVRDGLGRAYERWHPRSLTHNVR